MLLGDAQCELADRIDRAQRADLQRKAFAGAAGSDSGRLEVLQVLEGDRQLVDADLCLRRHKRRGLLEALREIAVLVEQIDQQPDQRPIPLVEIGERKLLVQVVAQGRGILGGERADDVGAWPAA